MLELRVKDLFKQFGGLMALNGVSLAVRPGERRGLIGPNGAGKTTLLRVISGEMQPTRGEVWLGDRRVDGLSPEQLARLGVARTFQRSSLFPELSALQHVSLARAAATGRSGCFWEPWRPDPVGWRALQAVGLEHRAHVAAGALSHGEQRQLEIACVLAQEPKVILLDEPLAGLAGAEREQVGRLLLGLPRELTVLLIEHDLSFVQSFADRITVLHYGEVLAEGTPEEVRADPRVQEVYVGTGETASRPAPAGTAGETLLAVQDLDTGYESMRVLEGVRLQVSRGEVVAVLGRNGAGKTTLLHTLMGFLPARRGSIHMAGRDVTRLAPQDRARLGMALVPQGRRMLEGLRVEEELALASTRGRWNLERVYNLFPQLRRRRHHFSTSLSGGEQQMVAIARGLLRNPALLLMDEPSEGLSPLLVRHVREAIRSLKEEGETLLLAEQNVDLALSVADRVYVLENGRVVFAGSVEALLEQPGWMREHLGVG
ncbi:MAG TPA: ATP-binding cassette domain-containing protein [Limnochordales bacterium]